LHENTTRKRKRVPVEKILSDANKVAKVKIEKVNNLLDDSKKATKAAEEEAQKAADALEDALECILCMDSKRDTLFLPCCHLNTCGECASMHSVCPTCKQPIERQVNNVYIS
jgi:ribosomal protein L32